MVVVNVRLSFRMVSPHGSMFHTVRHLSPLGIVEAVHSTHQIARNTPDALKLYAFAQVNFSIPFRTGKVRGYFRHCFISWLLIRPEPPRSGDGPAGPFRLRLFFIRGRIVVAPQPCQNIQNPLFIVHAGIVGAFVNAFHGPVFHAGDLGFSSYDLHGHISFWCIQNNESCFIFAPVFVLF
nr:MAG TPA_asm: hypothetical protein [Caudoviricetes sp.]